MCMRGEGGEWMALPILWEQGSVGRVSVFWLRGCGVGRVLGPGSGGVGLCLCEL